MFGELYGPYDNHTEVLREIHNLEDQGYKSRDIQLLADTRENLYFEKKEKVHFSTLEDRNRFLQTMRRIVGRHKPEIEGIIGPEDMFGFTQEEKENYYEHLRRGKIYLFISPKKAKGFDANLNDSSWDPDSVYEDTSFRIRTKGL